MHSRDPSVVPVVVAVFADARGRILLGERAGGWQLPRAVVGREESGVKALRRALLAEIGTDRFDILRVGAGETGIASAGGGMLAMQWYLLRFPPGIEPQARGFEGFRWAPPEAVVEACGAGAREAFRAGLAGLDLMLQGDAGAARGWSA